MTSSLSHQMPTLTALVVDDEPLSRRAMRQLLEARGDVDVVAEYASAAALTPETLAADVLFLDIQMPGRTGLEVMPELQLRARPAVVFVTAHDEFALPAFDTHAVDYLTKPVAPSRLDRAMDRVRAWLRAQESAAMQVSAAPASLMVRAGNQDLVLPIESITAIEADGVYAAIHANGRRYLHRCSLDALSASLAPHGFTRVHRSWLVPLRAIVAMRNAGNGQRTAVLSNGVVIPISRRRQRAVRAAIGRG